MKKNTKTRPRVLKAAQPHGPSLSAHYLASRVRFDSWNQLKTAVGQLVSAKGQKARYVKTVRAVLALLEPIENYWAFPGREGFAMLPLLLARKDYLGLEQIVRRITRALVGQSYRRQSIPLNDDSEWEEDAEELAALKSNPGNQSAQERPYFEVLVVDETSEQGEQALRSGLLSARRPEDAFIYDTVVVPSFEDAMIAVLLNFNIQAVVIRYGIPLRSRHQLEVLKYCLHGLDESVLESVSPAERATRLGQLIMEQRPELDQYLVTNDSVEDAAGDRRSIFSRVFYQQENFLELHLNLLRGIRRRADTPFFKALRHYAEQPTGVFHALPISRGKSILKSHWIQDMVQFYGTNIFMAETSATSGGLDSLLDPHGPIKEAQELAARAFGAKRSYFVTNGTTGANKIVSQAVVRPGDIVLIDRDCHKSHHYAMVLAGANVVYLDAYPLHDYSMYGAVSLKEIRRALLELKDAGKLDRVKMLILTNCTFDGIVYHPQRVMQECLAIKPDLVFLWDEAWFGFARFSPTYRRRTAMEACRVLTERFHSPTYAATYAKASAKEKALMPDPAKVRIRAYATQSTHKTLTSLRQGSMIHVFDQDFSKVEGAFRDAYMAHTSTSPNYQILASLDLGRRQVELEGFEMVGKQIELAFTLRETIKKNPLLAKWFSFLTIRNLIPAEFRPSGMEMYYDPQRGWAAMLDAWENDEFVLDPSRLTLYIGATGVDGDSFKKDHLMKRHGIQVNKTTRNSVLFMTNIGTTRSSVAHLINALVELANGFEEEIAGESPTEKKARQRAVLGYTKQLPPLPDFSSFHSRFRAGPTPEGDMRTAYYLGTEEPNCEYFRIDETAIDDVMKSGRTLVASSFLTPYPPGFPILVPGQVVSAEILGYLRALDTKEIHGYRADLGIRVFTTGALQGPSARELSLPAAKSTVTSKPKKRSSMQKKHLHGLSDIRRYFHRNEIPTYFISATNFNLLGLDEWVRGFQFVNHIDCHDGRHPNTFVPQEIAHDQFESIEDINNYLLQHKEVLDFMRSRAKAAGRKDLGKAVFLMFDEKTEALCNELGLEVCFPSAGLRNRVDNKVETVRIGDRAGVPSVPNRLIPIQNWADVVGAQKELGPDLVIQTAFGDSGHTTFFITTEADYQKHAKEIASEPVVKVMKRLRCRGSALEACTTSQGTIVGPLMTELVGFKELTPYKGGWCGNEIFPGSFTPELRQQAVDYTFKFGEQLRKEGYRGYFELDFLIDMDGNQLYLGELNPRITGASSMTNHAAFAHADAPLFLFHLLEFADVEFEFDVNDLNRRWADPENIDEWSQLVVKWTKESVEHISAAPESGIWRLNAGKKLEYARFDYHRRAVQSENEAYWLRISGPGDYLYEGADLGILITRGRLMTPDFELTDRARAFIDGMHGHYKALPVADSKLNNVPVALAAGAFKIL